MNSIPSSKPVKISITSIIIVFSLTLLSTVAVGDEVQTPSRQVGIGYETVGKVMSSLSGTETARKEAVTEAVNNLHEALAKHMEEKNVPDHVVERFSEGFKSLELLYESGAITAEQFSSEAKI